MEGEFPIHCGYCKNLIVEMKNLDLWMVKTDERVKKRAQELVCNREQCRKLEHKRRNRNHRRRMLYFYNNLEPTIKD